MRYEDVQDYILLQDMFQVRCEEVCYLLRPLNDSYRYLSEFEISDNEVWGEGDEYVGYGGYEHHSANFPSNFLWKDDEDIKQLQRDLNDMRDTVDTLSTELEQTKDILNSMTGGEVYNKTQIDNLMRGKVDKIEGFGLSSNDYTDEDRELLYSLATSNQIVFGTHWEFPNVGKENTLYIATDEGRSYYWDPISQIYMNLDKDEFKVDVIQSIL